MNNIYILQNEIENLVNKVSSEMNATDDEKIIKTVFYKEKKWEFEHEYRFHTMWQDVERIERNCKLLRNTIVEVILGRNMSLNFRKEIIDLVKQKYPQVRIIEDQS